MESFVEKMERQYTADLENEDVLDDDDDDENEGSDIGDYPATMIHDQPQNRKRTARQSTIVQVNTGALEIHLRQMKKQLARHEVELNHPVWMKELQEQLNKIPVLERRLEHCQLDVDNLRDVNISTEGRTVADGNLVSTNSIQAEIEAIRMIIRRVDVQNSFEVGVIDKVSDLQKSVSELLKNQRNGIVKNELMKLQDNLQGQINSVLQRVDEVDDHVISVRNMTNHKLLESERKNADKMEADADEYRQRFASIDMRLKQVAASAEANVHDRVKAAAEMSSRVWRSAVSRSLRHCLDIAREKWSMRTIAVVRSSFRKWREYDPIGNLRKGRRVLQLLSRAGQKMELKSSFVLWQSYLKFQFFQERLAPHLRSILSRWKDLSVPSMYNSFQKWKRTTILWKFKAVSCSQMTDDTLPSAECVVIKSGESNCRSSPGLEYRLDLQFEEFINQLNAHRDPLGCLHLVGLNIHFLRKQIIRHDIGLEDIKGLVGIMSDTLERSRAEQTQMVATKIDSLESSHSYYRTAMNSHVARIKQDIANCESKFMEKTTELSARLTSVEGNIRGMQDRMDTFFERMERLYGLHGNMLSRIDTIDSTQSTHTNLIDSMKSSISNIERNSDGERDKESRNKLDDALEHLHSEIVACRSSTRYMSNQIEEILSAGSDSSNVVSNLQREVQSDIESIEQRLDTLLPSPPSPDEVVGICTCYEDKAVEDHSKGHTQTHLQMSEAISQAVAQSVHTLAHHVVKAADIDVLRCYIRGPESSAPVVDSGKSCAQTRRTDFSFEYRNEFLTAFMESFIEGVRIRRPDAGLVRKEARRIFVVKFLDAMDVVISRLDSIELESPSALGRNYDSNGSRDHAGACIACDRPLKMRVTKSRPQRLRDMLHDAITPIMNICPSDPTVRDVVVERKPRPYSAGPIRSHSRQRCGESKKEHDTLFVKRGGFKSRLSESMTQEKLVVELLKRFPSDVSFPVADGADIQPCTVDASQDHA